MLCASAFSENAWKFCMGLVRFAKSIIRAYEWSERQNVLGEIRRSPLLPAFTPTKQDTTPASLKPHVIVVGAGPSGLLSAIHIAIDFPHLNILVLERDYPRTHEVRIHPDNIHDVILRDEVNKLGTAKDDQTRRMSINVLRACLIRRANALCICIETVDVADTRFLCETYPECRTILIAEGAHSKLRKELFGCDEIALDSYLFQNIVQVQYTTDTFVVPLALAHVHRVAQLSSYAFEESVFTPASAISLSSSSFVCKVTGRFFVSDNTYGSLPSGTQMKPMQAHDLCADLQESISIWMNVRNDNNPTDVKITKFQLSAYACRDFTSRAHMRNWILIGDAAFAVPYFRALNAGAFCSSSLPAWLRSFFTRLTVNRQSRMTTAEQKLLKRHMFIKFGQELILAAFKDAIIETFKTILFLTSSTPESSQINQWSYSERNALKTLHPIFVQDTSADICMQNTITSNACVNLGGKPSLMRPTVLVVAVVWGFVIVFLLMRTFLAYT
jgi:2-polyprenyl-6-methoxyphenol hydroxylase-like FAD-dependent oxidoreductase